MNDTETEHDIMRITDYLNQGEVWSSANGTMLVVDMDLTYRRRACDWLIRNTLNLAQLSMVEAYEAFADEPTLAERLRLVDVRPYSWIRRTPLYLALSEGIPEELLRRGRES